MRKTFNSPFKPELAERSMATDCKSVKSLVRIQDSGPPKAQQKNTCGIGIVVITSVFQTE
jgi:hypothetical protein